MLHVYCLDVGQGDCTVILPPDDKPPILFDCKDAHVAQMFVRHQDRPIRELSAVIFSHLDEDHIAGGEQFMREFLGDGGTIRYVYLDRDRSSISRRSKGSIIAKQLIDFVLDLENRGRVEVLAPRADPAEVDRSTETRD
jgi:beta-lactamase superfamily II metal-dependent hydrolase